MVLFAPEDIELVRGEPAGRRRYLDELLVARRPRFAGVCADYDRVLRQRNALLRTAHLARRSGARADLSTLDVWDVQLARHGAELLAGRLDLVAALRPYLVDGYRAVAGTPVDGRSEPAGAQLSYRSSGLPDLPPDLPPDPPPADRAEIEAALVAALAAGRGAEVERGVTTIGPHRDDLALELGQLPAKGYASHGESWSYAVALRLAAYRLLRADGTEPVLVLDDVFAELDAGRRERLARNLSDATQTLVTCAVEEDVPTGLRGARYEVRDGEVKRV
jgi:DNA replication and repair protein RecF